MEKDQIIKNAQYRKGLSIAFFNATKSSISLVGEMMKHGYMDEEDIKDKIQKYRNWMLEEHKTYYLTVVANVGVNYNAEDSIKKIKATKSLEELKQAWLLLSEDERRDGEIIKVVNQLKKTYEKTPDGTKK